MVSKNLLMSASSIQFTFPCAHTHRHGVQRVVRALAGPEAVAETEEVLLVDGVQDFDRSALDDLVLQRGHAQRALTPVGLVDVRPLHRLGPVAASGQPVGQVQQVALQVLPVALPGLAVHPGGRVAFEREVGRLAVVRPRRCDAASPVNFASRRPLAVCGNRQKDAGSPRFPCSVFPRVRGVRGCLAKAAAAVWPSVRLHHLGTPDSLRPKSRGMDYAAQYPACANPGQRFAAGLAAANA